MHMYECVRVSVRVFVCVRGRCELEQKNKNREQKTENRKENNRETIRERSEKSQIDGTIERQANRHKLFIDMRYNTKHYNKQNSIELNSIEQNRIELNQTEIKLNIIQWTTNPQNR